MDSRTPVRGDGQDAAARKRLAQQQDKENDARANTNMNMNMNVGGYASAQGSGKTPSSGMSAMHARTVNGATEDHAGGTTKEWKVRERARGSRGV